MKWILKYLTRSAARGALLATAAITSVAAQQAVNCGAVTPSGDIGLRELECTGRTCAMMVPDDRGFYASYGLVPVVRQVATGPGGANELRTGDSVLSVNGQPITTRAAAAALNYPTLGQTLAVRVQRGAQSVDISITPWAACTYQAPAMFIWGGGGPEQPFRLPLRRASAGAVPRASTNPSAFPSSSVRGNASVMANPAPTVTLGMDLACANCRWVEAATESGTKWVWRTSSYPIVDRLVAGGPADQAGIRVGDAVISMNGVSMLSEAIGDVMRATRVGQPIAVVVQRGGQMVEIRLTPARAR